MPLLNLTVNGNPVSIPVDSTEMLSDVLRYRLGLTGTKVACEESECGSCTVLLDGLPVLSCSIPALKAQGQEAITIEGISTDGLHALQEAFIQHGAVQCGFCTPGQIMTAYALLQSIPEPTESDIRHALKDTLCRCGCYPAIVRSIQSVAGIPSDSPGMQETHGNYWVIGKPAPRPDAVEKVLGTAVFTDDLSFPDMLHARVLRAGVPHGVLQRLDVSRARRSPGVVCVLTAEDIPGERNHGVVTQDWPVLIGVDEQVCYIGDAIALVAAESRHQAMAAVAEIAFEIEPLPTVSDPVQAHEPEAPKVHAEGNLLKEIHVSKGDLTRGFDQADIVQKRVYRTPTMEHLFMEPECSIARPIPDDRIEVYVGSQIPYEDREQIAASLGMDLDRVRVVGTLIGGGFGGKEDIAGQIHAALLAKASGRPVKLLYDRRESMISHPKRHATQITVRLGAKKDGSLTAAETTLYGDTGAYASLGEHVMTRATTHSTGPYQIPNVQADCFAMYTNNPPAGAFRGFGALQSAFAIESAMDELAEQLGIGPIEIRRINALQESAVTNTGQQLTHSVGLLECIDRVEGELRRIESDRPLFQSMPIDGWPDHRSAWGFAIAYKNTGLGGGAPDKAEAEIELLPSGHLQTRISSAEIGQGLVSVLQLIAAEEFQAPLDQVKVLLSDTDLTPDGGPTTGSRQTYVSGNAVRYAARILRQAVTATLAEHFDCPPYQVHYEAGEVKVNGSTLPFTEIATIMRSEGQEPRASYEYWAPETTPLGSAGDMHFAFSFSAQAAKVAVNMRTGEVAVLHVIAATDVGQAINPLGLEGQIEGGIIMGIGHALTEEFILEEGQIFTDSMARYRMPSIHHVPQITSFVVEQPTADGPYGAKGVGEISTMPTIPAILNAVYYASGVRIRSLPIDQDSLALQIAAHSQSNASTMRS